MTTLDILVHLSFTEFKKIKLHIQNAIQFFMVKAMVVNEMTIAFKACFVKITITKVKFLIIY